MEDEKVGGWEGEKGMGRGAGGMEQRTCGTP